MNKKPMGEGIGVDAQGGPVNDPTANVLMLVAAEARRQDDLRTITKEMSDREHLFHEKLSAMREHCAKEEGEMREHHQAAQRIAEAGRLDSIRQVDREDVAKTAATANNAILTLSKQTTDLATTLASQQQAAAAAAETRRYADNMETNKRLSALELAGSASAGKQTVVDPQMIEVVAEMRALRKAQDLGSGKSAGISWVGVLVLGIVTLIGGVFGVAGVIAAIYAIFAK